MKARSIAQYLVLSLKGVAMGAADVVPGVSGGTIAFISGIYQELIDSINQVNLNALKVLRKDGIKAFWNHVNGTFFFFLFAGIGISIASLAKVVTYLLETYPVLIWSFFFGLIIASVLLVGKTIKKWTPTLIASLLIGGAVAYYITTIQTIGHADSKFFIFISGAIAICAMILPGISGSFILVLMGSYHMILNAVMTRDMVIVSIFAVGCLVGILSFARVLKYLFRKFEAITVATLTGFMLGSLNKVWPWKKNIGEEPIVVHSDGREEWLTGNVWPTNFEGDAQLWAAIGCAIFGLLLIVVLEKFGPKEA